MILPILVGLIVLSCTPEIYKENESNFLYIKSEEGKLKKFPTDSLWMGFEKSFTPQVWDLSIPKNLKSFPSM
jgi:hypothetical protein